MATTFAPARDWNPLQAELRRLILRADGFAEAMPRCRALHAMAHLGAVSGAREPTLCDRLVDGLPEAHYRIMPTKRDETIAWHLWHLARIEDITMNLLVADEDQLFSPDWQRRMRAPLTDTGNAWSDEEILAFSEAVEVGALHAYRSAVAARSREILDTLTAADMRRKPDPAQVARILPEGGLTAHKDSVWLAKFWGKKTVAGLLLLPLTRHQCMHLNPAFAIKSRLAGR